MSQNAELDQKKRKEEAKDVTDTQQKKRKRTQKGSSQKEKTCVEEDRSGMATVLHMLSPLKKEYRILSSFL